MRNIYFMVFPARISGLMSSILLILNPKRDNKLRLTHTIFSSSSSAIQNSSHVCKASSSQKYHYKMINKNEYLRNDFANSTSIWSNSHLSVKIFCNRVVGTPVSKCIKPSQIIILKFLCVSNLLNHALAQKSICLYPISSSAPAITSTSKFPSTSTSISTSTFQPIYLSYFWISIYISLTCHNVEHLQMK